MKNNLKAFFLALVLVCSGSIASASTLHSGVPGDSSSTASARMYRIFLRSHAQRSGSFIILSSSQAGNFGGHPSLVDRTARAGELVLGLVGYRGSNGPARAHGLRAFVDASVASALRSAASNVRTFAAGLPDSSEPGILLFLGSGLMGLSLLVLRRRGAASV